LKKPNLSAAAPANSEYRLNQRSARFAREHEIERQKQSGSYKPKNGQEYNRHVNAQSPFSSNKKSYKSNSWDQSAGASSYHRRKFLNTATAEEDEDAPVYDAVRQRTNQSFLADVSK
jgi:hypothetical protein